MPRKSSFSYETCESIFAKRLTDAMKERGETQKSLAEKITGGYVTIQRQTISLYMNGQSKPDTERLTAIAKVLNVSSDWLLGLTDDTPTMNYSARMISDVTGISVEIIELFMRRKQYCEHHSDNYITAFNAMFIPENLNDLLKAIFLVLLKQISGRNVCLEAQSQLDELQKIDISESWEQAEEWKNWLESSKKEIRLARFDAIGSFTTALDTSCINSDILKKIDSLIDAYSDITGIVDQDVIDTIAEYEKHEEK